jgi:hypothetical protein
MRLCKECGVEKEDVDFYANGYQPSGLRKRKSICGPCFCKKRLCKHWSKIRTIIGSLACSICGYSKNLSAIEFHHGGGDKGSDINKMKTFSLRKLRIEMAKCICVCANCHREIHYPNNVVSLIS